MSKDDTYVSDIKLNTKKFKDTSKSVDTRITDPVLTAIIAARPFGAIPVFAKELKEPVNSEPAKALDGLADTKDSHDEKKTTHPLSPARNVHPTQFTLLPTGFQIESELQSALQFEALVRFAEEVLEKGYTIFGSFTQYLVWCLDSKLEPTETNTIKKFADTGFPMPADLDILDPKNTLLSSGIHVLKTANVKTIIDTELTYTPEGAKEAKKIIPDHSKHEISIPGLLPIQIRFDKVKRRYIDPILRDFDVNGIMFNKKRGLVTSCKHSINCKSLLCKMNEATHLHNAIVGIINRTAEFVGTFEPGPHMQIGRKLFISRIKKMLIKGWKIKYWDEEYPHVVLTAQDSVDYKTCKICMAETKEGEKHYLLRCNGTISTNGICEECFWAWLNDAAEKSTRVKCPLCREERLIFGNEFQLTKQKEDALKAKIIKVEQNVNRTAPQPQATNIVPQTLCPTSRDPHVHSERDETKVETKVETSAAPRTVRQLPVRSTESDSEPNREPNPDVPNPEVESDSGQEHTASSGEESD